MHVLTILCLAALAAVTEPWLDLSWRRRRRRVAPRAREQSMVSEDDLLESIKKKKMDMSGVFYLLTTALAVYVALPLET